MPKRLAALLPETVRQFIEAAVVAGDMSLPFHYPALDDLEGWQSGFRRHGITGESLVSRDPGAWQPGWYVIALNGFDDPFFIDIEGPRDFPVYYAPHGAGRWDATQAAPSIGHFSHMLSVLRDFANDDAGALRHLEAEVDPTNLLWREIYESRRSRPALEQELACDETAPDPEELRQGILVLTAVGPRKLEVVQFLRRMLGLSPQAALALVAEGHIPVGEGCLLQLRAARDHLVSLGATVEFRPSAS